MLCPSLASRRPTLKSVGANATLVTESVDAFVRRLKEDVEGEIDVYTAPRLRELLIDLVNKKNYQLVVNMEKVEFLDSTGLGVLVGGLKRVRAHDGSLDLVCTQERILKIFRITGLTKVFGIHDSVDVAIAARKAEK